MPLLLGPLAAIAAIIAQPHILTQIAEVETLDFKSAYKGVMQAMTVDTAVETSSSELNDLFSSGGMSGMLGTIWLIICAMVFGGFMDAIGALSRISKAIEFSDYHFWTICKYSSKLFGAKCNSLRSIFGTCCS